MRESPLELRTGRLVRLLLAALVGVGVLPRHPLAAQPVQSFDLTEITQLAEGALLGKDSKGVDAP